MTKPSTTTTPKKLYIYDLDEQNENALKQAAGESMLFSAAPKVKHCIGCFCCWIKTPGKCVINDRSTDVPALIAQCSELVIVTPILYGGYSQNVKAVLDRAIGYILPYFRIVDGEMHHRLRYENTLALNVCFYGECDDAEKELAKRLVKANAINYGATSHTVRFCKTADEAGKVIV